MICQPDAKAIDDTLSPWREVIGADYPGYRNHVVRMLTFCQALRDCDEEEREKLRIAGCFHDIGLWTANTLDYLEPSLPPAHDYLEAQGLLSWRDEIDRMILLHHKLRPVRDPDSPLVELFRRGDLIDFSLGLFRFGLSRAFVRDVKRHYPNAGFHKGLTKKAGAWFLRHPLNPAPMMKW